MIQNKLFLVFVLVLIVGGGVTGYGYWLEKSSEDILENEIPYQENLLYEYTNELEFLQRNALITRQDYEKARTELENYCMEKAIEYAISAIIPSPISIISSKLGEIGELIELVNIINDVANLPSEIEEAKKKTQPVIDYYNQYQLIQNKIEEKKKVILDTEEKIEELRDIADIRLKNADNTKFYGWIFSGIGVFGLVLSVFKKRR